MASIPPGGHRSTQGARPWRTIEQASARAQVSPRTLYAEVRAGRLRAARVGGRRQLRLLDEWIDDWLFASAEPVEIDK
jgi:excisionase family DNA binding protein